jgi:hypothetical protein
MKSTKRKTPAKYNGGQLDNVLNLVELLDFKHDPYPFIDSAPAKDLNPVRYIVGCDWLELYLKGDLSYMATMESYEKGDWSFTAAGIRSKFYRCSHSVYYRGELFGVLLHQPREGSVLPVEAMDFKIDNQQFYKRQNIDLKISHFLAAFEVEFANYTRVDLYIDFNRFNDRLRFSDFVTAYSAGQIESKGKVQSFNKYHEKVNGEMQLTGFSYGSRTSDKFIRCYDKTVELQNRHKPYIQEYWLQNGFEKEESIYRFEVQLNSKFFRKTKGERLKIDGSRAWELANKQFSLSKLDSVLALLQASMNNYFDFFVKDNRVRNDDKQFFEVFDWAKLRNGIKRVYNYVREKIVHKGVTWRQKMIVARNMFREYVVNFQDDNWLFFVAKVVHDYQLYDRWNKRVEPYVLEFTKLMGEKYLFNWKKLQSSFSAALLKIKYDGMQGKQMEFVPVTYSLGGRVVLTPKTW